VLFFFINLFILFRTLFSNVYLQNFDLNLANNDLGIEGARAIIALAAESANLVTLDLSENEFGDEVRLVFF